MTNVAVVICTYNVERYVAEALDSVLAQTQAPREVIVVDSSTDRTPEIVRGYGSPVRYLYQEKSGSAAARMAGIRAAEWATYVKVLDGDDIMHPQCLELEWAALEAYPDAAQASSNCVIFCEDEDFGRVRHPDTSGILGAGRAVGFLDKPLQAVARSGRGIWSGAAMFRRSMLMEAGGYDEALDFSEDLEVWARLAAGHPGIYFGVPLFGYRIREGQKTNEPGRLHRELPSYHRVADFIDRECPQHGSFVTRVIGHLVRQASRFLSRRSAAMLSFLSCVPSPLTRLAWRWRVALRNQGAWAETHPELRMDDWRRTDYRDAVFSEIETLR